MPRWRSARPSSDASIAPRSRSAIASMRCITSAGPGVGDVLDGRAVVDPLARASAPRARAAARGSARASSARCARVSSPDRLEVERVARRARRSRAPRLAGISPSSPCAAASAPMMRSQVRVRPSSPSSSRVSVGRPQVAVDDRVGGVDHGAATPVSRAAPARTSSSVAPHGTTIVDPVALDPALEQAALDQRRPPAGARQRAGRSRPARAARAPYSATWIWRERSQPTSVQSAACGGPASRKSTGASSVEPGAAAREQVVPGRVGGGELAQVDRLERRARPAAGPRRSRAPRAPSPAASAAPAGRPRRRGPRTGAGSTMKLTCSKRPCTTYTRASGPRERRPRHLRRVAGVDRRVDDERDLVRARRARARRGRRRGCRRRRLALDLHDRVLVAARRPR